MYHDTNGTLSGLPHDHHNSLFQLKKIILKIFILISFSILVSCGGDSGSDSVATVTGQFVDDPVQGLNYSCSSGDTGITNSQGEYTCYAGDMVTFSLGSLVLGNVLAQQSIITPYSLFPDNVDAAINLARLLQSIDLDGDPDNGVIEINQTLASLLTVDIDFESPTFVSDIEALGITLTSYATAVSRLNDVIIDSGGVIPAGAHIPVADAGTDQFVGIAENVTLDGSASSDEDGDVLTYSWTVISAPAGSSIALTTPANASTTFTTDVSGEYIFELEVSDGRLAHSDRINVTAISNNANLATLIISDGMLSPAFNTSTTSYTAAVDYGVSSINITPTVEYASATIIFTSSAVSGLTITSGTPQTILLAVGANTLTFDVTAEDGSTNKSYSVIVTRTAVSTNANLSALVISDGTLSPAFNASTISYTAAVDNDVSSIDVTPAVEEAGATIMFAGFTVISGAPRTIPLAVGFNTLTFNVTAADGITSKSYSVVVTRSGSPTSANLSALLISDGALSPAFNTATTSYTAAVNYGVSSINVTPTAENVSATITFTDSTVSGVTITSGAPRTVPLAVGSNTLTFDVTSEDGGTNKTYAVIVTRAAASTNANLSALVISEGLLSPAFSTSTTSYAVAVDYGVSSIDITPTVEDVSATITFTSLTISSGAPRTIPLDIGDNTLTFNVTAEDGSSNKSYTVIVTRAAASTNANLANLVLSVGSLNPVFSTDHTTYVSTVPASEDSLTVTPIAANAQATITVSGQTVASGSPSSPVPLGDGDTLITVEVTAEDGITTMTYSLIIDRPVSNIVATPTREWAAQFDNDRDLDEIIDGNQSTAILTDASGNVYVLGNSTRDGIGIGDHVRTLKYSPSGTLLWAARYSGPGVSELPEAMTVDSVGNVYVTVKSATLSGWEIATIKYNANGIEQWVVREVSMNEVSGIGHYQDADDGQTYLYIAGTASTGSSSSNDYRTIKYAAIDGSEEWRVDYTGPGDLAITAGDTAAAMVVDVTGNVVVTGTSLGNSVTDYSNDIATVKYNKDGVEQWVSRYEVGDDNNENAYAIGLGSAGSVYISGRTEGADGTGFVTLKYEADGNLSWGWVNTAGSYGRSLAVDSTDAVIVTGYGYTVKYNASGVQQWGVLDTATATYGGNPIAIDASDNIYIAGTQNVTGESNDTDFSTVKLNSSGIQQWVVTYASPSNVRDESSGVAVYTDSSDQSVHVLVTGTRDGGMSELSSDIVTVQYDDAGTEQWNARFGDTGSANAFATGMALDDLGNVYVVGYADTGLRLLSGTDDNDIYAVKYDSFGAEQWRVRHDALAGDTTSGDRGNDITVDEAGYVYVLGGTKGLTDDGVITLKYDNAGNLIQTAQQETNISYGNTAIGLDHFVDPVNSQVYLYVVAWGRDINNTDEFVVIKYDRDLVEQWVRTYNYVPGNDAIPAAFKVGPQGNIVITGKARGATGDDVYATVLFDKNGDVIWENGFNLQNNYDAGATDVEIDAAGRVYVTGQAAFPTVWNFQLNRYDTDIDCVTVKYDVNGDELWATSYDNGEWRGCEKIAVDMAGNVFVATTSLDQVSSNDYLLIKYNSTGAELWSRQWDSGNNRPDELIDLAVGNMGIAYVTGFSDNGRDNTDYSTLAYDGDGNLLWFERYNGGDPDQGFSFTNRPVAIQVSDDNSVHVTGMSTSLTTGRDFGTVKYSQDIQVAP